jgi:TonB family protein
VLECARYLEQYSYAETPLKIIAVKRFVTDSNMNGKSVREIMILTFSTRTFRLLRSTFIIVIATMLWNILAASPAISQTTQAQTNSRKLKVSVPPEYPELARKMNIQGVARVLLTVASDGRVVGVKELGGNPVLVASLVQAVHKWKYESADRESDIEVRFEFTQNH